MRPLHRLTVVRERAGTYDARKQTKSSTEVVALLRPYFAPLDREHFVVLLLDGKNKPIGYNVVSVGTLTASLVHPREVFKTAIMENAAAIVLAHNHPSGDPTPSAEDHAVTQQLVHAGDILGIRVLDHVVISEGEHYSFCDHGTMPGRER